MTPQSQKAELFSLTTGGFLHWLQTRLRLIPEPRFILARRVPLLIAVTWLPLVVLTAIDRTALPREGLFPLLYDLPLHVRFLLAAPLLLFAEPFLDRRLGELVGHMVKGGLVPESSLASFEAAIDKLTRRRDSILVEIAMLLVGVVIILWVWRSNGIATHGNSWFGVPGETRSQPALAGWWYMFVSIPLTQFLFLRWLWRIGIWTMFLSRLARLNLQLQPHHI